MAFPWAAIAVVASAGKAYAAYYEGCLLYTSPSPRD